MAFPQISIFRFELLTSLFNNIESTYINLLSIHFMDQIQSVLCNIINQLYVIETKVNDLENSKSLSRRFDKIKTQFKELNLHIHDPLYESYDETRLDCEASIAGSLTSNLKIVEVIKPIVYYRTAEVNQIIQRGIVIVEGS